MAVEDELARLVTIRAQLEREAARKPEVLHELEIEMGAMVRERPLVRGRDHATDFDRRHAALSKKIARVLEHYETLGDQSRRLTADYLGVASSMSSPSEC